MLKIEQEQLAREIEEVRSELKRKGEFLSLSTNELLLVSQRLDRLIYCFLQAGEAPEPPPQGNDAS